MNDHPIEIQSGIFLFNGKISQNMMIDPMVSHTYFLEDHDEVIVFDPSCGKKIGKRIEAHIRRRQKANTLWKYAYVIAGHSHFDHANNFYLADIMEVQETHVYLHEAGFQEGKVKNDPVKFLEDVVRETKKYYNPFLAFQAPYNIIMFPFAVLDFVSPKFARKIFGFAGGIVCPKPKNGSVKPEPLKESELQTFKFRSVEMKGWKIGRKIIIPTPGHSPCSVSLYWPDKKAIFVSDADWIGNPVFTSASLKDCISSLKKMRSLAESENIEIFLPAHGKSKKAQIKF